MTGLKGISLRTGVFQQQADGDECPLRGPNYQLMRNFLFAAALAEREQKSWFGVLAIGPTKSAVGLRQQVANFRETILHPRYADRVMFATYETYIDLLIAAQDESAAELGRFLEERIGSILGS